MARQDRFFSAKIAGIAFFLLFSVCGTHCSICFASGSSEEIKLVNKKQSSKAPEKVKKEKKLKKKVERNPYREEVLKMPGASSSEESGDEGDSVFGPTKQHANSPHAKDGHYNKGGRKARQGQAVSAESSPPLPKVKKIRILSIDGGGIRGLAPATLLNMWEVALRGEFNDAEIRIAECFDVAAGTSTGGIIAAGLNVPAQDVFYPRYDTETLVQLYSKKDNVDRIFTPLFNASRLIDFTSAQGLVIRALGKKMKKDLRKEIFALEHPQYKAEGLEELFSEYFEELSMNYLINRVILTSYNMNDNTPHYFDSATRESEKILTRDAVRATSAAPTFFDAAKLEDECYVDGGLVCNNPTLLAMAKARHGFKEFKEKHPEEGEAKYFVVSLGTGTSVKTPVKEAVEKKASQGLWGWKEIHGVIMDNGSTLTHDLSNLLREKGKIRYYRFQPTLESVKLDDTGEGYIKHLSDRAKKQTDSKEYESVFQELRRCCEKELLRKRMSSIERALEGEGFESLDKLSLRGIPLTEGSSNLKNLRQVLSKMKGIINLDLSGTGLDGKSVTYLNERTKSHSFHLEKVKVLDLSSNRFINKDINDLSTFLVNYFPNLKVLCLMGNKITEDKCGPLRANKGGELVDIDFAGPARSKNIILEEEED